MHQLLPAPMLLLHAALKNTSITVMPSTSSTAISKHSRGTQHTHGWFLAGFSLKNASVVHAWLLLPQPAAIVSICTHHGGACKDSRLAEAAVGLKLLGWPF
jgi:hypothetical protein